ncbi:MAG TPA: cytochrome P450 [Tepidiformaceae bacterium]|nr:cytochrome P450 [Tepidiformaceae bacterium]
MTVFNPFRPAYAEDPYPILAGLRSREPVHWSPGLGAWVVTSYADCHRALSDDGHFSSNPIHATNDLGRSVAGMRAAAPLGAAPIMGSSDPPEHTRLRAIVNRAFTPRMIATMRPRIEQAVDELMGSWPGGRPVDVVPNLCEPLAITTVLAHLGVPREGWMAFREWSHRIMRGRVEGTRDTRLAGDALAARDQMLGYLARVARAREATPGNGEGPRDALAALLDAAEAGEIGPDELTMLLVHVSLAGNGPTAMAIANCIAALAANPGQLERLLAGPELVPAAVEECLRYDSPTHYVNRFCIQDVRLGLRGIKAGQMVYAMVGAANRDPARFPDPDRLDICRQDNRHLSFGMGIHFCLGAPLARLELDVVLRKLLERFGRFRVVEARRGGTFQVRGFERLEIMSGQ